MRPRPSGPPAIPSPLEGPILAASLFGSGGGPASAGLALPVPCPVIAPGPAAEIWPAAGPVEPLDLGAARAAADGSAIAASLAVPEAAGTDLEERTFAAYRSLLGDLERAGYPHLLRLWNYVPGINDASLGLERYKLFSKGRAEAFEAAYGPGYTERLPASSAVGGEGGALIVHAIAAVAPGRHVENPRQVAAYRYPARYGPRSPSFARATIATGPGGEAIFVSGTASVVGHESVFPGDAARQAEETMTNVEAVVAAAAGGRPFRAASLRAYVRRPRDLDAVRAVVTRRAPGVPAAWLRADICRKELLVEIEAVFRAAIAVEDARGLLCPVPVSRARRRLGEIPPGGLLDLLADDPLAPVDVQAFCAEEGHDYLGGREEPGGGVRMTIRRGGSGVSG